MTTRALHTGQLLLALTLLIAAEAASGLDMDCRYSAQREASIDTAGATHIEVAGARAAWNCGRPGQRR